MIENTGEPIDGSGTDIFTALYESCKSRPTEIILVTDGMPKSADRTVITKQNIICSRVKAFNSNHARLYTIGLGVSSDSSATRFLQRLALENNGMCRLFHWD